MLMKRILEHILKQYFMFRNRFNSSTQIVVTATKYLEKFARLDIPRTATVSLSSISMPNADL